jgi:hypothetical protein
MRAGVFSIGVLSAVLSIACIWTASTAFAMTDGQVRDLMIKDQMAAFKGACPCPYSFTSQGLRCGTQSVWSKHDGTGPACYRQDIGDPAVADYRKQKGLS